MKRRSGLYDAERHAVLAAVYAKEGTTVNQDAVGAYRTKTTKAGDMLYISCYPLIGSREQIQRQDAEIERLKTGDASAKAKSAYAKYNNARRIRDFEQLTHANFSRGDLHVACTYDPEEYGAPDSEAIERTRADAQREIRNYIARIKRLLKREGCDLGEFRWILCTVTREGEKEAARPRADSHHHHMLMHGVPDRLRTQVEMLWPYGYCNADRLQPSDTGVAQMAGYIARQEGSANGDQPGRRSYSTSRNIIRPEVTTSDSKVSRRRVAQIASEVHVDGRKILEKIYPGYRLIEEVDVKISDFVAGAYIYARLRRKE